MSLVNLKKELIKLDKDKIIAIILDLYKKNAAAKEFLDFYANPNELELFEKYKAKVYEAFYPKRGFALKLKDGKKAISDFKKIGGSNAFIAELMLFYAETGVEFTNEYGDIGESFYFSIESTYHASLKLMDKENILDNFAIRAKSIVDDTCNIGWGFHDELSNSYSEFYE